jgi:hypothetical protein
LPTPPEPPADESDRAFWLGSLRVLAACMGVAAVLWLSGATRDVSDIVTWCGETLFGVVVGIVVARQLVPPAWFTTRLWAVGLVIATSVSAPLSVLVICRPSSASRWS